MEAGKTSNLSRRTPPNRLRRFAIGGLLLAAAVAGARILHLISSDSPETATKQMQVAFQADQAGPPRVDEIPADLAILSAICPQGYQYAGLNRNAESAGSAGNQALSHLVPPYQETASRTQSSTWLVPKSEWFVSEDGQSVEDEANDSVPSAVDEIVSEQPVPEPSEQDSSDSPNEYAKQVQQEELQPEVKERASVSETLTTEPLVETDPVERDQTPGRAADRPASGEDTGQLDELSLPEPSTTSKHPAQKQLPEPQIRENSRGIEDTAAAKDIPVIGDPEANVAPRTAVDHQELLSGESREVEKSQSTAEAPPEAVLPDAIKAVITADPEVVAPPQASTPQTPTSELHEQDADRKMPAEASGEQPPENRQRLLPEKVDLPEAQPAVEKTPLPSLFAPPAVAPVPSATLGLEHPKVQNQPVGLGSPHSASHKAAPKSPAEAAKTQREANEAHRELFAKNCFPSARECGKCHKKVYEEWSISSHAYAFMSPMYHRFEQKISEVSQGTVGYFCQRCHSPVGTAMKVPRDTPLWEMAEVAREGVTCIACHRVNQVYGKTNGERRVVPGDIHAPVYGGIGGDGVAKAIADKSTYKVKTSPDEKGAGQPIHNEGRFFQHLGASEFCTSCHQVAVQPGIKLEVVWEQYRASPACKKGITCQSCHMGTKPGVPSPYEVGSIADLAGGKSVSKQRLHANHTFYGPGYSIAHPGIFPQHEKGNRWTIPEWLAFDWRAGWGTDDFEDAVADGKVFAHFPEVWKESDDRFDAREIIEDNLAKLKHKRDLRMQVMENGSQVAGPFFKKEPCRGEELKFNYVVTNLNEGHNLPTASLGAQPQLWANVVLIGPNGQRLWETGYTDSYGDLADIHSEDVRHGRLPFDWQLFNLQTMFLITGATGTDREFFLPVNIDIDQVAQLRPGAIPVTVTNHPPFIRMESRSLPPLGSKRVEYRVPAKLITQPGTYRLSFRMRSRTEPIYFMRFCDSTTEMQRSMNEGILDFHTYSVEFQVR